MLKGKRGQSTMQLPFGVIFSIFLIIFFIAVAFFVISKFLGWRDCSNIGLFKNDLQSSVDRAIHGELSDEKITAVLPSSVKYVCFADKNNPWKAAKITKEQYKEVEFYFEGKNNMYFYPPDKGEKCDMQGLYIKSINITKITSKENPFCVENKKGKINLKVKKEFGENLASIER